MKHITQLAPNEVFVFGSNRVGFHGGGAAGYACRGESALMVNWRADPWFVQAKDSPPGSPDRVGLWAIYGVGRGFQQGLHGMSFAIQTIERPGAKRSTSLEDIGRQFGELIAFCKQHQDYRILMTEVGADLAGYSKAEMLATFDEALRLAGGAPSNLVIPDDLYGKTHQAP